MTENKLLLEAIGNENLQKILKEIREIVELTIRTEIDDLQLEILCVRARTFVEMRDSEILSTVKGATGEDLDVILGNYKSETPGGHF